jgi:hypothetical protein
MPTSRIELHTRSLCDEVLTFPLNAHIHDCMINLAARYYTYYYATRPAGCGSRRMRV